MSKNEFNLKGFMFPVVMSLMLTLVVSGCRGEERWGGEYGGLISFDTQMEDLTKTGVVTSMVSFYISATTGAAGSESSIWGSTLFESDGAPSPTYTGGRFWPQEEQDPYCFYASNRPLSFSASGTTVSASADMDVMCAYQPSPVFGERNTLVFEHVFSRIGDVTVTALDDYTVSQVDITISPMVSGTYDLRTKAWSGTVAGAPVHLAPSGPGTKSNDVWLVPGAYRLSASWHAEKDVYVENFVGVLSDEIVLVAGRKSSITLGLEGNEVRIVSNLPDAMGWTAEVHAADRVTWE